MTKVSEMVERVARACAFEHVRSEQHWEEWTDMARAAIEAMREPTDDMKAVEGVHWDYNCHICGGLKDGWQAMIDAALKEQ